ncbi:MAG: endonuclease/exonuclease/phosphatase family protein [Bacteroidota bacterium]
MLRLLYTTLLLLTLLSYSAQWLVPNEGFSLALLGLLSPAFWGLTLLATGLAGWRSSRWGWAGVLVLLLGSTMLRSTFAWSLTETVDGASIRLASFNANSLIITTGRANQNRQDTTIARFIQSLDADILCIQEYRYKHAERLTTAIQGLTGFKYLHRDGRSRLILFSRYPLANGRTTHLPNNETNGYQQIQVATPLGPIHLCNIHLQTNAITQLAASIREQPLASEAQTKQRFTTLAKRYTNTNRSRTQQVRGILADISTVKLPTILCGDFNDVPQTYLYRLVRRQFQDAHLAAGWGLGATYEKLLPWLRIDYILPDPSFKIVDFERFPCPFSDHHAIVATMQ